MMKLIRIRIHLDFNGNQIGQPEIINILPDNMNCLDKVARIYARMIQNDFAVSKERGEQGELKIQKSERKSC